MAARRQARTRRLALVLALVGATDTMTEGRIEGIRSVVAPRAARRLQDKGFTTRRFSTDSMGGWRAPEPITARQR